MRYQIYGDLLKIYLSSNDTNSVKNDEREKLLADIIRENGFEYIVIDCEEIDSVNSDLFSVIGACSESNANFIMAVNANEALAQFFSVCFIDVSLAFNYIPDTDSMTLILEEHDMDINFVAEKIVEFIRCVSEDVTEQIVMNIKDKVTGIYEDILGECGQDREKIQFECKMNSGILDVQVIVHDSARITWRTVSIKVYDSKDYKWVTR